MVAQRKLTDQAISDTLVSWSLERWENRSPHNIPCTCDRRGPMGLERGKTANEWWVSGWVLYVLCVVQQVYSLEGAVSFAGG